MDFKSDSATGSVGPAQKMDARVGAGNLAQIVADEIAAKKRSSISRLTSRFSLTVSTRPTIRCASPISKTTRP